MIGTVKCGRASLRDANMLSMAINRGWIIPEEAETVIPADIFEAYKRAKGVRAKATLAKVIDTMKRTNQAGIMTAIAAEQHELGKQVVADVTGNLASIREKVPGNETETEESM